MNSLNSVDDNIGRNRDYQERGRFEPKSKCGRMVGSNYQLVEQINNAIQSNASGRDVDAFKSACLTNKAILFDSTLLKVDAITRIEDPSGQSNNILKIILHYGNKSSQTITNFSVNITDKSKKLC